MPGTPFLLATLGILAGAMLSVQSGINAQLSRGLGHPVLAAAVSFTVGLTTLLVTAKVVGAPLPGRTALAGIPLYAWFAGGMLGATYMCANIFLTPRLGTAAMMSLAISGQLAAALLIDRFGLLGLATRPVSPLRLVGVLLLLGGAVLVTRY